MPTGATGVAARLMAYMLRADPDLSAVLLDSPLGRAHVSAAGVPKKKSQIPRSVAAGVASAPKSTPDGSAGDTVPCACA